MRKGDPPNILLILADQHRHDCVAAHEGSPEVLRTPHLDRLVREGASFSHAFCPAPICAPSRCSLLTGVWPTTHGVLMNADAESARRLDGDIATFSRTLRAAGYWLGLVGKWQVDGQRTPREFGFDHWVGDGAYPAWRKSLGLPPVPRTNGFFGEADPYIAPAQSRLAWGADHVIDLLRQRASAGGPFCLCWHTSEPHLPNVVPEPFASMYRPADVPPWRSFPDSLAGKPYIQAQQRRTWRIDGWAWERWAPIVARYLGEVSLLDEQVGRILAALDELALAEGTLVAYSTDHGDLCGAHGMIDKHYVMYEDVVRVPLILRWPGRVPAGRTCDAFACNALDLAATFCRAAGAQPPATFQGRDLLELIAGAGPPPRQDIFASYHGNQFGLYSQRMVRDRRWKYVWNATAEDELYDLATDPAERRNLARDPAAAEELSRLRKRLVAWMEQLKDPLLNGWTRAQLLEGLKA